VPPFASDEARKYINVRYCKMHAWYIYPYYHPQVPPFASDEARAMIVEALGTGPEVKALMDSLSRTPVAAASLGQVQIYIYIYN